MGLPIARFLALIVAIALIGFAVPLPAQDPAAEAETAPEPAEAPRRPDSPSLHLEVLDVPGAWQAMEQTQLRQSIEALLAIPFIASDPTMAALSGSLEEIAREAGIEPTIDSLVGENTRSLRLIIFDEDKLEKGQLVPFILDATMATPELAGIVAKHLEPKLAASGIEIRAPHDTLTMTNAPERLIQDRMADWRAPVIGRALEMSPLEGAQIRFFAQPERDEEPAKGDRISGGHIRLQPTRIDIAMQALPARADGELYAPSADNPINLDRLVSFAEQPHVLSLAYHGAGQRLQEAFADDTDSRGRFIASILEYSTGAKPDDLLQAFGEEANLAINSLAVRSLFDFSFGISGVWQVRDHAKAAEVIASLKEAHLANLIRESQDYGRSTEGIAFVEEAHRDVQMLSAPLMIFPFQPTKPPTLNLALTEDALLAATSRESLVALIDRYLDGPGESALLQTAREELDLPTEAHSLTTVDFGAMAQVFRRSLPVLIVLTQGGQESQVFGRALADVVAALGTGVTSGVYSPDGQSVRATLLLAPPNPAP
jgi:hypothetical protein